MVFAIVPVVMIVIGALTYALSSNAKAAELGRLCAMAGLFALAFANASKMIGT